MHKNNYSKTFSPASSELFWCEKCGIPLLAERCSTCHSPGHRMDLAPPGDIRLCSRATKGLLSELIVQDYGTADLLDDRIILLNKIAGLDRRDQVMLEGRHIATLWFDVVSGFHRLDLESAGASLLCSRAKSGLVVCDDSILKGHIKGKWLAEEKIISGPPVLTEGQNLVLKIGKFS
ncbi:MAG: hypothetical protein PHQ34_04615, partial [Methanothrix sp.]|nr:hypothetical protein [Methanothrix sp.]